MNTDRFPLAQEHHSLVCRELQLSVQSCGLLSRKPAQRINYQELFNWDPKHPDLTLDEVIHITSKSS